MSEQKEDHIDFTTLAKQIDSNIDPELVEKLKGVEALNILLKCDLFGNEELIPVGSCVDGSKVTVPNDSGDIDVLMVPNRIILKEFLFDYDKDYPAFLHIRTNGEHEKYFKTVKDPIEGVYLPAAILKEFGESLFYMSKLYLNAQTCEGISKDGTFLNVTRSSAVGKEQMKLYPGKQGNIEFVEHPETLKNALTTMEKFAKCALGGIVYLANNIGEIDTEDGSRMIETYSLPKLHEHENTSLLEMLHKLLNKEKGKETNDSSTRTISDMIGDRQTETAENGKCDVILYTRTDINKETIKNERVVLSAESMRSDASMTQSPQDCTANETKRNVSRVAFYLDHGCLNKTVINLDSTQVKDSYSTVACVEKRTKHGTAKGETSFAKLKSTDFVPAFKFEGWPRVADEWLTRSRKWPSKITLKKILESGCQVVAKRPSALHCRLITEDRDPYFRLSFALSVIILAKSMKEQQLLCWRVLKAYQKCFLETRPKCLTSYHWKNAVLWVSEDLDESFWTDDNVHVAVKKCLDFMQNCLQKRNLPFYFVRNMNLLNVCDEASFAYVRRQIEAIRREPLEFLKKFITEPPNSETHVIDIGEIEYMLSQEAKSQKMNKIIEDIVSFLPFLYKNGDQGEAKLQQLQSSITNWLEKVRSETEDKIMSQDAPQAERLLNKMWFDIFDNALEAMINEDGEGIVKCFNEYLQLMVSVNGFENEHGSDSGGARNISFGSVLNTISSTVTPLQKDGASLETASTFLLGLQQFTTLIQEGVEIKHENCEKSDIEAMKTVSTIFDVVKLFFKGIQNGIEKDENINFIDEFTKFINEASQRIRMITESEDKTKKKSELDIDLD